MPPGIDLALLKEYQIEDLNLQTVKFEKYDPDDDSPLKSIAMRSSALDGTFPGAGITADLALSMHYLPWKEVYGLSYTEVRDLPFDEWCDLVKVLRDRIQVKKKDPVIGSIEALTERITQLFCVAFNVKRKEESSHAQRRISGSVVEQGV